MHTLLLAIPHCIKYVAIALRTNHFSESTKAGNYTKIDWISTVASSHELNMRKCFGVNIFTPGPHSSEQWIPHLCFLLTLTLFL